MDILVINCGSSTLRFQLINMEKEEVIAKGKCDKIGIDGGFIEYKCAKKNVNLKDFVYQKDHNDSMKLVVEYLTNKTIGAVENISEINAVGHRIVSGGEKLTSSKIITPDVIDEIERCTDLAPLHNPGHLMGIRACASMLKDVPMVAVFDTAFHQTMPQEAYLYGLPYKYYEKYKVRKYGAHGTSHRYVTLRAADMLNKDVDSLNMISCHMGNGASICAIKNGKSVDTSMGLTPLEGLIMGTRTGDMDPAVAKYIIKHENMTIDEYDTMINKEAGLLGISGITSDVRELKALKYEGNEMATLALQMQAYRVRKYIGAYMAVLGHVDAITFEGGIAENNPDLVKPMIEGFEEFGVKLSNDMLTYKPEETIISAPDSKIKVLIIPTDEELMIAKDTLELISKK